MFQLALNPLDLSSQKTKVSVGRSGSIGGRRPPTRVRSINLANKNDSQSNSSELTKTTTRLCQQNNNSNNILSKPELKTQPLKKTENKTDLTSIQKITSVRESLKNIGKTDIFERLNKTLEDNKTIQKESKLDIADRKSADGKSVFENFETTKSENELFEKITKENGIDSTTSSPIEFDNLLTEADKKNTDRRLNTALRNNSVDLDALDQILKNISSDTIKSFSSDKPDLVPQQKIKPKRHSFITVESLKEVRGRLRRTSSPTEEDISPKLEDLDDGIVSEDNMIKTDSFSSPNNRVKSYVYGMENMIGPRKNIIGTGSLESRTSSRASNLINRSEDWYNRRKSYGFEQVHNQTNSISLQTKNKIESSTDSGICRSTELFAPQNKQTFNKYRDSSTRKPPISTVVNLEKNETQNELFNIWNKMSLGNNKNEQITITIPIVSEEKTEASRKLYHRQFSENSSISIEQLNSDNDLKRHSIAVDESKYVGRPKEIAPQRRKSLVFDDSTENFEETNGRKKRVEFCKTEVHFAAESGRVNIVETDEKPPPTNNFRRRRRNSGLQPSQEAEEPKNGLPLTHFGDTSYEKQLFSIPDHDNIQISEINNDGFPETMVTVSSNSGTTEIFQKELPETECPKGILKNKIAKPKPYLLGDENPIENDEEKDDNTQIWGVKLRHVQRESPPFWKSTVTVQNNVFNQGPENSENSPYKSSGGNSFSETIPKSSLSTAEDNQVELRKSQSSNFSGRSSLSFRENNSKVEDYGKINRNFSISTRNSTSTSLNLSEAKMEQRRTNFSSSFAEISPKTQEDDRVELRRTQNSPYTGRSSLRIQGDKNDDLLRPSSLGNFQISTSKFQEETSQRPTSLFDNSKNDISSLSSNSWRLSSSAYKVDDKPAILRSSESFRMSSSEEMNDLRKPSNLLLGSTNDSAFKTPTEIKKSAWTVADRVKQVENFKYNSNENKGYSTKVNFGSGQTTVVESDRNKILWPEEQNIGKFHFF